MRIFKGLTYANPDWQGRGRSWLNERAVDGATRHTSPLEREEHMRRIR
jgi:hypothetical protein